MATDDGGPAFPRIDGIEPHDHGAQYVGSTDGVSVRDYFAAQALAGLLANTEWFGPPEQTAREAGRFADAMLAERERGE